MPRFSLLKWATLLALLLAMIAPALSPVFAAPAGAGPRTLAQEFEEEPIAGTPVTVENEPALSQPEPDQEVFQTPASDDIGIDGDAASDIQNEVDPLITPEEPDSSPEDADRTDDVATPEIEPIAATQDDAVAPAAENGVVTITVLDDASEQPIAGATVKILKKQPPYNTIATGVTDNTGQYTTSQLPGGTYQIRLTHPNYALENSELIVDGDTAITFRLPPLPGGALSVTVLDDASGQPITGATVRVRQAISPTIVVATGSTDNTGNFTTGQLPGASFYWVQVFQPGYFTGEAIPAFAGDTAITIRLTLKIAGILSITALDDASEQPIAGAIVDVFDYDTSAKVATGVTNDTGLFTAQLPGGDYWVYITTPALIGEEYPTVDGNTAVTVRLTPRIGGTFSVTTYDTQTNTPIPGAAVEVFDVNDVMITTGITDSAGRYTTGPLLGGYFWASVSRPNYQTYYAVGTIDGDVSMTVPLKPNPIPTATPTSTPVSGEYAPDDQVNSTTRLNLRAGPSVTARIITVLPKGAACQITGDPIDADSYRWYPVDCAGIGSGFVAGDFLKGASIPTPTLTPTPTPLPWMRPATRLNLRSGPGTSNRVVGVLPVDTACQVVGSTIDADGYTWYPVNCVGYGFGYIAGVYTKSIAKSGDERLPIGSSTTTTTRLNLRSGPGTGNAVVAVLPGNTPCQVTGGPSAANGYTWYAVNCGSYGSGYVAGAYLRK